MEFVLNGHTYKGPEPEGSKGLEEGAKVWAVLDAVGMASFDPMQSHVLIRRLWASPVGRALVFATLSRFTRDGAVVAADLYTGPELSEPFAAAIKVWLHAGFFALPQAKPPGEVEG